MKSEIIKRLKNNDFRGKKGFKRFMREKFRL